MRKRTRTIDYSEKRQYIRFEFNPLETMSYLLTQFSLLALRLGWGYILITDLHILHLPPHLEEMLFYLYLVLLLFKTLLVFGKVEITAGQTRALNTINWLLFFILIVACIGEFYSLVDFSNTTDTINHLAGCLIMITMFVASEILFDTVLHTRSAKNGRGLGWIGRFVKKLFGNQLPKSVRNNNNVFTSNTRNRINKNNAERIKRMHTQNRNSVLKIVKRKDSNSNTDPQ